MRYAVYIVSIVIAFMVISCAKSDFKYRNQLENGLLLESRELGAHNKQGWPLYTIKVTNNSDYAYALLCHPALLTLCFGEGEESVLLSFDPNRDMEKTSIKHLVVLGSDASVTVTYAMPGMKNHKYNSRNIKPIYSTPNYQRELGEDVVKNLKKYHVRLLGEQ